MNHYSTMQLLGLLVAGILIHWFMDLKKSKAQGLKIHMTSYLEDTWLSSMIAFLIGAVVIFIRHEMNNIPYYSEWEGGFMALIGYVGDSLIPLVFGFAKSKGLDLDKKD